MTLLVEKPQGIQVTQEFTRAAEPGHVFLTQELPADRQHLAGWKHIADNDDGTMLLVQENSASVSYKEILEMRQKAIAEGHAENIRPGNLLDWYQVKNSGTLKQLDLAQEEPYHLQWQYLQNRYMREQYKTYYPLIGKPGPDVKKAKVCFFQDVPSFKIA